MNKITTIIGLVLIGLLAFVTLIAVARSEPVNPSPTEQVQPEEPTPPGTIRVIKGQFIVPCAKRADIMAMIEHEGLVPLFVSESNNGEGFVLLINNDTKVWTIVNFSEKQPDMACFISIGKGYKTNPEERKASL